MLLDSVFLSAYQVCLNLYSAELFQVGSWGAPGKMVLKRKWRKSLYMSYLLQHFTPEK